MPYCLKLVPYASYRYYLVERAKDANIVGIVVGTLGVGGFSRRPFEHIKVVLVACDLRGELEVTCRSCCCQLLTCMLLLLGFAAGYESAICNLRKMILAAQKKAYVLLMGKPNPAKLANFPEVLNKQIAACKFLSCGCKFLYYNLKLGSIFRTR